VADLIAELPAYAAIALVGVTFLWSERRYRSIRKARREAAQQPTSEGRLEVAREDFDDIVSVGGESTKLFLDKGAADQGNIFTTFSDRADDPAPGAALLEISIA
jgi:hypothetical protein